MPTRMNRPLRPSSVHATLKTKADFTLNKLIAHSRAENVIRSKVRKKLPPPLDKLHSFVIPPRPSSTQPDMTESSATEKSLAV